MEKILSVRPTKEIIFSEKERYFSYRKGQILFYEGTRPMGVFLILKGKIKTFRYISNGKTTMTSLNNRGCIIGYTDFFNKNFYRDNAIAVEDSEVIFVPGNELIAILNSNPQALSLIQKV